MNDSTLVLINKPSNSWDVDINLAIEANNIINKIKVNNDIPMWLNQILHDLTWHKYIHTSRWITENKELLLRCNNSTDTTDQLSERLKSEIIQSITKLKS